MDQQPTPQLDRAVLPASPQPAWPPGGGVYRQTALPHNPLRVVELSLALVAVATAFMPWFALGGAGACPYSDLGPCGDVFNATIFDVPDLSGDPQRWLDFVLLGFALAVLAAAVGVARRGWRPAALVEIAGFSLVAIGVGMALTSGPTDWLDYMVDPTGFTVHPSFGPWLCLLAASVGAVLGLVHLVRPDIGRRPAKPYSAPAWGAPAQPAWGAPAQPWASGYAGYPNWAPPAPPAQPAWAPPVPAWAPPVPPPMMATLGSPPDTATPADIATPVGPAGQLATLENGRTTAFEMPLGRRIIVGRGPGADLVIADPGLSSAHAAIERRGPGWLVSGLDGVNPTFVLDSTGRPHPVSTDLGLRSGTLLVGTCQVLLYPPRT